MHRKCTCCTGKIYSQDLFWKMDGNSINLHEKKLDYPKKRFKKLDQKWVTDDSFVPLIKLKNIQKISRCRKDHCFQKLGESIHLERQVHLIGYMQNEEKQDLRNYTMSSFLARIERDSNEDSNGQKNSHWRSDLRQMEGFNNNDQQ